MTERVSEHAPGSLQALHAKHKHSLVVVRHDGALFNGAVWPKRIHDMWKHFRFLLLLLLLPGHKGCRRGGSVLSEFSNLRR